ncbi:hypothetical protein TTHERM_000585019 (macronuclear) [Tetrahymena thermophila SB210]|uniref:Uncharacterized protein n=1 Tax=Tetrahymena thermophila (strain SB210) TaxID=312017 RepID=W7X4N6_TETTS|nr:hypothetical protein TTHERM_000585019 [Tetrahymena thermophila SB210]EWS72372.1 hypothetical protein TTHERM_000585019 [Tetrahymena thermophila SB210]|eukprot:XP_012655094.1 hypothetical protein TTHERM_000585019 [Tetrahymena thermophila SB210]
MKLSLVLWIQQCQKDKFHNYGFFILNFKHVQMPNQTIKQIINFSLSFLWKQDLHKWRILNEELNVNSISKNMKVNQGSYYQVIFQLENQVISISVRQ